MPLARAAARLALIAACLLPPVLRAAPQTIVVGPGGVPATFAEAVLRAQDGDTIAILPGEYKADVAVIPHKKLTIRGVGKRPVFRSLGTDVAEGKAIWVIRDGDITIDNVEFRGARAQDLNGAGIRFEHGRLALRNCVFEDNENAILTGNDGTAELLIEDSVFNNAPRDAGSLNHLVYVGRIARLAIRGSRFHDGARGHLIKSRAGETRLEYNLIADGPTGTASYEVDLPNGGDATLVGNVIVQAPGSENPVVVAYGAEGSRWPRNRLRLAHNTLVNDRLIPAWFVRAWRDKLPADAEIVAVNNLTVGPGLLEWAASGRFAGNWPALGSMLAEPVMFDYALGRDAWPRGRAVDAAAFGADLVPTAEFRLPLGTVPIVAPAAWSPGAFQR